jgi:hypothetical protein
MARDQPLGFLTIEDDAAFRIDGDYLSIQLMLAEVLGTPSQGATGAYGAEQVIDFSSHRRHNLIHCLVMRVRVVFVGVLIGPKAILGGAEETFHPIDARFKKLTRLGIGFRDEFNLRPVDLEEPDILLSRLRIDDADESQAIVRANLSKPDSHVA